MSLSKLTTEKLEAKLLVAKTDEEKKAAKPATKTEDVPVVDDLSAAQDFGKQAKKADKKAAKEAPAKAAKATAKEAPAKAAKATAKEAPAKAAKAAAKAGKATVRSEKEYNGKKNASFTKHRSDEIIKGPIARILDGTDGHIYIGVKDAEGVIRYKQEQNVKFF